MVFAFGSALLAVSTHWWWSRPLHEQAPLIAVSQFSGETMGSTYDVQVADPVSAPQRQSIEAAIAEELALVDRLMSGYREDSQVEGFNRWRSTAAFAVAPELAEVVESSLRLSELSGGAFDITVAPMVALWGFGPHASSSADPPSDDQVRGAMAHVGYSKVRVTLEPPTLAKTDPELTIDLNAVAPGYATDRILHRLALLGFAHCMVDVGGEVRVRGEKAPGVPWRIGVERPDSDREATSAVIRVRDQAIATSGDYRNYYERDGKRVSHSIDARTGRPISHALASVTVVTRTALEADGWATALSVLGAQAGLPLAEAQGLAVLMIERVEGAFRTTANASFSSLVVARETTP